MVKFVRNERASLPSPISTLHNPCKIGTGLNDTFIHNGTRGIPQHAAFAVHRVEEHCIFSPRSAQLRIESKSVSPSKGHINQHVRSVASSDPATFCNSVGVIVALPDPIRSPIVVHRLAWAEYGISAVPTRD